MITTVYWSTGFASDRDSEYLPGVIDDNHYESYDEVREVIRDFIKDQGEPGEKETDYDVCRIITIIQRFPVK
jgi:hypothetical protein